jgi:hypothetical protein
MVKITGFTTRDVRFPVCRQNSFDTFQFRVQDEDSVANSIGILDVFR